MWFLIVVWVVLVVPVYIPCVLRGALRFLIKHILSKKIVAWVLRIMFVVFNVIHWRYDYISDISLCFRIWNDSSFASNIAGVIVESGTEIRNKSKGKMLLFFLKTKVDEGIFFCCC